MTIKMPREIKLLIKQQQQKAAVKFSEESGMDIGDIKV